MIDIWDESTKIANTEDSRALLNAYNNRLKPADTPLYQPVDITAVAVLLRFVTANFCPGSEDLIPDMISVTMERFWKVIENKLDVDQKFAIVNSMGAVFESFG